MGNIIKRHLSDFQGGWFIGDFSPSLLKTDQFEVSMKLHPKGEVWPKHYHKIATEFNCVVVGKVKIDDVVYGPDDIFIIEPNYVVDPEFLEDCKIICVKTPSVPDDKYIVER